MAEGRLGPNTPIGIFDSGVGGLTVLRAIERVLPGHPLVYLGDTARVPYGTKSAETVIRYSREAASFLRRHDVGLLVVACNSASSVAMPALQAESAPPAIGVLEPGAEAAIKASPGGRIGVIGTRATIHSGGYAAAIRRRRPEAVVLSRACPLLVPLAEEGWTRQPVARSIVEHYVAPLQRAEIDTLVLGCTHYPLLKPLFAEVLGPQVHLVDSAEVVASVVRDRVVPTPAASPPAAVAMYVTDQPAPFQRVAERFLGRPVPGLRQIELQVD